MYIYVYIYTQSNTLILSNTDLYTKSYLLFQLHSTYLPCNQLKYHSQLKLSQTWRGQM